jgi:hypothetical protein
MRCARRLRLLSFAFVLFAGSRCGRFGDGRGKFAGRARTSPLRLSASPPKLHPRRLPSRLTSRSSRPRVVASAMCFTLRSHMSAAPPQGGLTPALGAMRLRLAAISTLFLSCCGCASGYHPWYHAGWDLDGCEGPTLGICHSWQPLDTKHSASIGVDPVFPPESYRPDLRACLGEMRQAAQAIPDEQAAQLIVGHCMLTKGWRYSGFVKSR